MTRRERLENKLAKRQEWAVKAAARSERAYIASNAAVAGIPLGQPILVGHHSERRHRNAIDKAQRAMSRSCEESNLAKHHESKANGIERQLERTIFSDDENAIEALREKIAGLESTQEKMRLVNATIRKHAKAGAEAQIAALVALGLNITPERAQALLTPDFCGRIGFASYELTNNNANIRRLRERIKIIETRQQRTAEGNV